MNIPTLQNEESDLFDLSEFCHSLEMENFSNHMFLAHKGARTGAIGGDDPFEESIWVRRTIHTLVLNHPHFGA